MTYVRWSLYIYILPTTVSITNFYNDVIFLFRFVRLQVQDNVSDMQLRHERYILVPPRRSLVLVQDTERGQCQAQGPDIR